jgi:hypothetical protein
LVGVVVRIYRHRHHERSSLPVRDLSGNVRLAEIGIYLPVSHVDELYLFFQNIIVLHGFLTSEFKEDAAVSRVVEVEKPSIILSDFRTAVILVITRSSQFIFILSSFRIPLLDVLFGAEVELLKFVDEVALVAGEVMSVNKIRLPQGACDVYDVCLLIELLDTVIMEVQALNAPFNAFILLAAARYPRQKVCYSAVTVQVFVGLPML